ncbi:MAG: hypothetical protein IJ558_13650 [Treponema sp.]|nr:hypothetical protein [Treponema sp.]
MDFDKTYVRAQCVRFFLCAIFLCGCASFSFFDCPYEITSLDIIHTPEAEDDVLVVHFLFENLMNRPVEACTVSFILYDDEGNTLALGSEAIVESVRESVGSNEACLIRVVVPSSRFDTTATHFRIDYFYLRDIHYADGSIWRDPYGRFCLGDESGD